MQIKTGKKGQTVVESLMTYGWMIVLVAAVLIVVFLLGLFSPLHFISPSSTISGFTGVKVTAVIANYSYMEFYLTNSLSVSVNLNKFSLLYNNTRLSNVSCQYLTLSPGQNSICFTKLKLANTRDTVSLGITFAISSVINASSNGTMSFVPTNINLPLPSIITEFSEEGLPTGSQWWVDFKGANHTSTGTEILFASVPGNYSFIVGNTSFNGCTFTALPSSGYSEAGLLNNIIFINSCAATFIEKELPLGTKWKVEYAGVNQSSTTNLLVFTNEKRGTYPYSVNDSIVAGCIYQPSPSSGSLAVGQYQYIRFLGECTTTFTESGLPSGYKWNMSFDGLGKENTTSNIYYFGSPGNYSYSISTLSNSSSYPVCSTTYTPSPSSNTVAAGSTVLITFSAETTCTTTFTESGLPSGYQWDVTYNSIPKSADAPADIPFTTKSSGSSIPTYPYSIPYLSNSSSTLDCKTTYAPSPSSGSAEAGTTVPISFTDFTVCITTFTETGLGSGTVWSVTYNGNTNSGTAPSDITFKTNTTGAGIPAYSYTINKIAPTTSSTLDCTTAATPTPSSGTNLPAGSTVAVSFAAETTCITTFDESNLPTNYLWNVTFNNTKNYSTSTSMEFTTVNSGSTIPSLPYSVPTLTSTSVEWNFGTSSYQGDIYQGMPTEAFPSSLSDLNNNVVACGSPYDSQGYTAVGYMYFTSSITVTITSDDAMAVFYTPVGSNSWTSVFGSNAWHGEGATQYGPTTVSVTPGWYEVAVDWTNICGPGMSAFEINGAYMLSSQFNVIGWTPSNDIQLLPYSDVSTDPASPSDITVEQTGSWSHEFNGYFTYTYTPSPSSNTVSAGSTNSISYSTSGSSTTEFYETNLPSSASSWSVSYDNGAASGSNSAGSPITLSLGSQSSQNSYPATATADTSTGLACTASASVEEGTTYTFTNWLCRLPVYIDNTQGTATPAPFQQELIVNSQTYSQYEASNLDNVEFTYANGTIIPSWLESGNSSTAPSTVYWLKIGGGIPANSEMEIYINFALPTSTNVFNTVNVGEAPQLSPNYAEYDDGADVFNVYSNFAGTSLPSDFTSYVGDATLSVDNGLHLQVANNGCSSTWAGIIYNNPIDSADSIVETYSSGTRVAGPEDVGLYTGNSDTAGGYAGVADTWGWGYGTISGGYGNIGNPFDISSGSGVASIYWIGNGNEGIGWNYNFVSSTNTNEGWSSSLYASIQTGECSPNANMVYYWFRVRAYPPNGVMPYAWVQPVLPSGISDYTPLTISNTQSSATSTPFQQLVTINPSSPLWSYINHDGQSTGQNLEFMYGNGTIIPSWLESNLTYISPGYSSSTGSTSASTTVPSDNYYLCAGGDGNGALSSYSWTNLASTTYTSLGYQSSPTCSDSSSSSDIVVGGVSLNQNYISDQVNTYNSVSSFSWQFTVPSNAGYTLLVGSCGWFECSSISLPAGCSQLFFTHGGDNYETAFAAACNLNPGSYTVSGNLNGAGYVSIGAFYFYSTLNYWIKLGSIPAYSSEPIYIGVASTSTNLFNGNTVGEAPQLSSSYAEYDNGANVFNYYTNFAGTSLPSGWSSIVDNGVASDSVSNGLTLSVSGTNYPLIWVWYDTALSPTNEIFDAYSTSTTFSTGVETTEVALSTDKYGNDLPSCGVYQTYNGYSNNQGSSTNSWNIAEAVESTTCDSSSSSSFGGNFLDGVYTVRSINWQGTGNENAGIDYTRNNWDNTVVSQSNVYFGLGLYEGNQGDSLNFKVQWARERAYPPNGVMPSVNIGPVA